MTDLDVTSLRKYFGLKQIEFADKIGIAQSYLSEIERGLKPLTNEVYNKITNAFDEDSINKFHYTKSDNIAKFKGNYTTGNNNTQHYKSHIGEPKADYNQEASEIIKEKDNEITLLKQRVESLIKEIEDKERIINEKERLIQTLLNRL